MKLQNVLEIRLVDPRLSPNGVRADRRAGSSCYLGRRTFCSHNELAGPKAGGGRHGPRCVVSWLVSRMFVGADRYRNPDEDLPKDSTNGDQPTNGRFDLDLDRRIDYERRAA